MMSIEYINHINLLNDQVNRRDLFNSVSGDLASYTIDPDRLENWKVKTRDGTIISILSQFEPQHFHLHYHPAGDDDPGIGVCSDYDAIAHVVDTIWTVINQCSYDDNDDPDIIRDNLDTANRDLSQAFEYLTVLYVGEDDSDTQVPPAGPWVVVTDPKNDIEPLSALMALAILFSD